jgi:hypothetical protein
MGSIVPGKEKKNKTKRQQQQQENIYTLKPSPQPTERYEYITYTNIHAVSSIERETIKTFPAIDRMPSTIVKRK